MNKNFGSFALSFTITLAVVFLPSAPSQAATVHNETSDGDLSASYTSPTPIGQLGDGTNSVIGSMPGGFGSAADSDWLSFSISSGTQLMSIVLTDWGCSPCNSGWSVNLYSGTTYLGGTSVNNVYNFGVNLLPLMGLGTLGPGTYTFGTWTGSYTISSYQFDFTVESDPAVVPIPAALPLFSAGLGVIGLFGWFRRRRFIKTVGRISEA